MMPKSVCKQRVLVVEDDEQIRSVMFDILTEEGFRVDAAENGSEALKLLALADSLPCVILLDMMMPVMNGWQFLEEIRSQPEHCNISVVIVSAANLDVEALRPSGYLRKPVEIDRLVEEINIHC